MSKKNSRRNDIIDILIVVLAVTVTGGLLIVSFVYEWKKMLFFLNQ